ncbi:MAG: hypothetical protein JWO38_6528 [Gemmataceae bacterium]|nr:hypothetical protein [Gemmataceae bacterium]
MGWEKRQRGGLYYYRSVRINGQPRRIYLGTGQVGRIHELLDRRERRAREAALTVREQATDQLVEADRLATEVWQWSRTIAAASLVAAGWYNHHGQWRRAAGRPRTRHTKPGPVGPGEPVDDPQAGLEATIRRAHAGDAAALAELRALPDERHEVWQAVGDMNRRANRCWRALAADRTGVDEEALSRVATCWKDRVLKADPTPAERALADAAEVARLVATHAEVLDADAGLPARAGRAGVKRLAAAMRRLGATLKLLARVQAARPLRPAPVVGAPVPFGPHRVEKKAA